MPTYKSIIIEEIHHVFYSFRVPSSHKATFGKGKRFIKVGEVPPDRAFPMNGIMVVKFFVINVLSDYLPSPPNGSKNPSPLDRNNKLTSHQIAERKALLGFSTFRGTTLYVISNKDLPRLVTLKGLKDPFGVKRNTLKSKIFKTEATKFFIQMAPSPFHKVGFSFTSTI